MTSRNRRTAAPGGQISAQEVLAEARELSFRMSPGEASVAMGDGAVLVDIRQESQIKSGGLIPGAVWIARNILEWRLEPRGKHAKVSPPAPSLPLSGLA